VAADHQGENEVDHLIKGEYIGLWWECVSSDVAFWGCV
jgi:hypothetical protein